MPRKGYAHYIEVLDRSGSMAEPSEPGSTVTKAQVATNGVNKFNAGQRELPGKATFTVYQFDSTSVDKLADFADSYTWDCVPRMLTPLRDALGQAITEQGAALAAMPEDERPERVYVIVATDGLENSSKEYSAEALRALVKQQTEQYKWEFVYIGADLDAFAESASMGVAAASTLSTNTANKGAMAASYAATQSAVTRSRASGQSVSYTGRERKMSEYGTDDEAGE
jgi:hypothetical protein